MTISSTIPIPTRSSKLGKSKYDFKKLKVGQSFPVEESKRFSVATLAKKYGDGQTPIKRFSIRVDEKGKMRCWRIE